MESLRIGIKSSLKYVPKLITCSILVAFNIKLFYNTCIAGVEKGWPRLSCYCLSVARYTPLPGGGKTTADSGG